MIFWVERQGWRGVREDGYVVLGELRRTFIAYLVSVCRGESYEEWQSKRKQAHVYIYIIYYYIY